MGNVIVASTETIKSRIYEVRGRKVMLDQDLVAITMWRQKTSREP